MTCGGLSRRVVAEVVGPVVDARIYQLEVHEMAYGIHWDMTRGFVFYTAAGLELILTVLAAEYPAEVQALREAIAKATPAAPARVVVVDDTSTLARAARRLRDDSDDVRPFWYHREP